MIIVFILQNPIKIYTSHFRPVFCSSAPLLKLIHNNAVGEKYVEIRRAKHICITYLHHRKLDAVRRRLNWTFESQRDTKMIEVELQDRLHSTNTKYRAVLWLFHANIWGDFNDSQWVLYNMSSSLTFQMHTYSISSCSATKCAETLSVLSVLRWMPTKFGNLRHFHTGWYEVNITCQRSQRSTTQTHR